MKKKSVAIALIIFAFSMLNVIFFPFISFAEEAETITFQKAQQLLLRNNKNLRNLEAQIYNLKMDYEHALNYEIDEEIWYNSNSYRRMQLLKIKELNPLQIEHALLSAQENLHTTRNNLILSLRDKYLSLLLAKQDLEIKNSKYLISYRTHELNKTKFNNKLTTQLELQESEYSLFSSQTELNISRRNYENACRDLNLFVGCPIDVNYSKVEYELLDKQPVYALSYCIENALKNRREIKSLQRELHLKQFQKELIERNNVYITYTSVSEEHKSLLSSINLLELQFQKTTFDINKEIMDIYYNTMKEWEAIESAEKKLDGIKAKQYLTEAKIKAGVVPESMAEQVMLEIQQAEYEILNAIFKYNTALLKLGNAAELYDTIKNSGSK